MAKEKNSKGKYSHNRQAKVFRNWGVNTWEEIKEKIDGKDRKNKKVD
jgi:stalled ribosome alternative rescue factor ArfA